MSTPSIRGRRTALAIRRAVITAAAIAGGLVIAAPTLAGDCPQECGADLDRSGMIDGADLGMLLADWGSLDSCANLDGSADGVGGEDLGLMLAAWGECLGSTTCPGTGDCCEVHPGNGCSDETCCESVCFTMLSCCETGWDQQCVNIAESVCDGCTSGSCPGTGDCCAVHPQNGCSDETCCESVCFTMLACCETGWDQQCVNIAESVCSQCE